ncbi:hypothetical protein V3C99_011125, partial [Haemonchus contortus]
TDKQTDRQTGTRVLYFINNRSSKTKPYAIQTLHPILPIRYLRERRIKIS